MERSVWGFKITYSNADATWIMRDGWMALLEDVMFRTRQEAVDALFRCVALEDRIYSKRLHDAEAERYGNDPDSFVLESTDGYLFSTMVDLYDKVLVA